MKVEDIPDYKWPKKPKRNRKCLHCNTRARERFSWFCGDECEDIFVKGIL